MRQNGRTGRGQFKVTHHFSRLTSTRRLRCNLRMATAVSPRGDTPKDRVQRKCEGASCRQAISYPMDSRH
jgi:hypothetical protein